MTKSVILNGTRITLDARTGGILRLQEPEGTVIMRSLPGDAGLIDLAYPLDSFGPLRLATPYSQASGIDITPYRVTVSYNELGPSRADLGYAGKVSARVTISAHPDGKSLVFEAEVTNYTDKIVPQILFPDLRGLQPISGADNTWFRQGGVKMRPFLEIGKHQYNGVNNIWRGCWWEVFPPRTMWGMGSWWGGTTLGRWSDFGSLKAGLSVYDEGWYPDPEHSVYLRLVEGSPEHCRMCFTREIPDWDQFTGNIQLRPQDGVQPGQSWHSARFIVTPHAGGWPKGIEAYRSFVRSHPAITLPRHIREEIGFKTIVMAEAQENTPEHCEYLWCDIPAVARECKEAGISELVAWSGNTGFKLPIPLRPVLGSEEEYRSAMQACRDLGVNFSMFISVYTLDQESSQRFGGSGGTASGWSYHTEAIPAQNPGYYTSYAGSGVDTANQEWQEAVLESIDNLLALGTMSFSWDQYVLMPGERTIDWLAAEILRRTRATNPMASFASECTSTYETESRTIHYTWNWREITVGLFNTAHRMADYATPALSVWLAPRMNLNVEDDPTKITRGFTDNLYLNFMMRKPNHTWGSAWFHELPAIHALIQDLAALRRQFLAYFTDGILLGDGVMDRDWTKLHVAGYQLQDRLLLFVLNDSGRTQRNVRIGVDLARWFGEEATSGQVTYYDIQGQPTCTDSLDSPLFRHTFPRLRGGELQLVELVIGAIN